MNSRALYNKIDRLRREKDLTVNKLSDLAGISHSTLNAWKVRGTIPKLEVLEGLCDALNISLIYLLTDIDVEHLSGEQMAVLEIWDQLNLRQRESIMQMMKTLRDTTE